MDRRIIWQYWETVGEKPRYIDGLRRLVENNSGVESVLVTPESLPEYLPDLPEAIRRIEHVAHRADMIRAMLIHRYGGMWLDSDAIVLRDLGWLFDYLDRHEFVGYNDHGRLRWFTRGVRVNCFLSRPGGAIITEWMQRQQALLPRTSFKWNEIGSDLLHPACLHHGRTMKVLPFEDICPIQWYEVEKFLSAKRISEAQLSKSYIVMLSNVAMGRNAPQLQAMTVEQIADERFLLSPIMKRALIASSAASAWSGMT